ncbi:hypothetical protein FA95DRAFT_1555794 [Auriscalpium vulgare]|uniref:Uncharacterized protein n=1 Tax=Auriscalpium vulgare TaxID=40419 RepID=A0ACB8S2C3_9AGAM|nr:hypothetical protein FA95DRAFT_1555794 [Auriscalpium vulgare]
MSRPSRRATAANAPSSPAQRGYRTNAQSTPHLFTQPTNIRHKPQRKKNDAQKRRFFGIGEIIQVVANPASTLRSLTESRRLLEETRREMAETRERAQLRPSHTFSRLPNFFPRPAELEAVGRVLEEEPCFTVLFGASSVGKTALLRQLLTSDKYHVLHFDLRIAGFADLESLYMSLSQQMEQYFIYIAETDGYQDFEKEAWGFKHDRLSVERRLSDSNGSGYIKTSDIARLMELFQSSLLKYREFVPTDPSKKSDGSHSQPPTNSEPISQQSRTKRKKWWRLGSSSQERVNQKQQERRPPNGQEAEKPVELPPKKMPVFFLDEAHKLPGLIQSVEAMKSLLDSMLVLTKQDRLCHVIHATSDPFYQTWLRQLNVMQHCKIITIGDCSKAEARAFYEERILPRVPEHLRRGLDFERLYEAFGGRLVHWQDYVTDYVNANGRLEIHQSSHFIQAHALLNLHIIHSSQAPQGAEPSKSRSRRASTATAVRQSTANLPSSPTRGGSGFPIYSPLTGPPRNPHGSSSQMSEPGYTSDFTAIQLLRVMSRLTQPGARCLPYFMLCREFGVRAVDGMVRGRILDLRWMDPITKEGGEHVGGGDATTPSTRFDQMGGASRRVSLGVHLGASSSGTAIMSESVDLDAEPMIILDREPAAILEDEEVFGPKVLPATPIMRYAMREVVAEYEDTRSVSEYASLEDVEDVEEY